MNPLIRSMYERLAEFLLESLNLHGESVIVEAGCGKGQLTIPFAEKARKRLSELKIVAFDVSSGPYEGALNVLRENMRKKSLEAIIVTIQGDVGNMEVVDDESVNVAISNELFCDVDREGLKKALKEFYRILKPNGQMAHGELNPVPENIAQRLLIEADHSSLETMTGKYEWFSPYSDEIAALMHRVGFKDIMVKYFETDVRLPFEEAVEQLREWKVSPVFMEENAEDLKNHGMEFPIEHVIFCKKPKAITS